MRLDKVFHHNHVRFLLNAIATAQAARPTTAAALARRVDNGAARRATTTWRAHGTQPNLTVDESLNALGDKNE